MENKICSIFLKTQFFSNIDKKIPLGVHKKLTS